MTTNTARAAEIVKKWNTKLVEGHGPMLDEILEREITAALDAKDARIERYQRVLAIARMVNRTKPNIRMTHALAAYDREALKKIEERE